MKKPDTQDILSALRAIQWKDADVVTRGMIGGVTVGEGGKVSIVVQVTPDGAVAVASRVEARDRLRAEQSRQYTKNADYAPLQKQIERTVAALDGVSSVAVILTSHQPQQTPRPPHQPQKILLPNVTYVVAVASGKGGVGKSTTSVNLAAALAQKGLKVGLLDADIYGPSIPRMLAVTGKPESDKNKKMIPHQRYGMAVMSMGFLIAEDAPMIWRGPMVHAAITQLFRDVDWGTLDIMIVDLPPGTGDAQLTMAQSAPLSGAIIVSTPQDIALLDARKGLAMFQKVDIPVLGIIENMSYFLCPHCGGRSDIFSHGGARREAEKLNVPFLGEIPLDIAVREQADQGMPLPLAAPAGELAKRYQAIADTLWAALTA